MIDGVKAQAVAAIANAAGKGIDAASGVGRFVEEVSGIVPQNLIGVMGGDWLEGDR